MITLSKREISLNSFSQETITKIYIRTKLHGLNSLQIAKLPPIIAKRLLKTKEFQDGCRLWPTWLWWRHSGGGEGRPGHFSHLPGWRGLSGCVGARGGLPGSRDQTLLSADTCEGDYQLQRGLHLGSFILHSKRIAISFFTLYTLQRSGGQNA